MFWHGDVFGRVLSARIRKAADPRLASLVRIDAARCRKAILRIGEDKQYLQFTDRWRIVQLDCTGQDIGGEPFTLEIVLDRFPDIEGSLQLAKTFADLYRNRPAPRRLRDGSVEGTRHRDALAALDRRRQGWSYREIAVFLHGEAEVRRRWNDPDQTLKNRTIRSVKRGLRMMNGGYRMLLR